MDSSSDLHINCAVRKVMVRHWIDLGKLSMRTTRGVVRLGGALNRLPGAVGELNATLIMVIIAEIKRVPHVRRVSADFTNWRRVGLEGWSPIGILPFQPDQPFRRKEAEAAVPVAPTEPLVADGFKAYDVEEEKEKEEPEKTT